MGIEMHDLLDEKATDSFNRSEAGRTCLSISWQSSELGGRRFWRAVGRLSTSQNSPSLSGSDDADKAEKLIRNLAKQLEHEAPGVAASIVEGLDEILTVTRLGLPSELQRSLACINIIENMMGTLRRVCRNVKRCDPST
jgi:hypothetical protein